MRHVSGLRARLGLRALGTGQLDVLDLDACQLLAVAVTALVSALGLELDDTQLRSTLVAEDGGSDGHAADVVAIDDILTVDVEQWGQRHARAVLVGQPLDEQVLTLLDAVLLATGFDDCVHDHSEEDFAAVVAASALAVVE